MRVAIPISRAKSLVLSARSHWIRTEGRFCLGAFLAAYPFQPKSPNREGLYSKRKNVPSIFLTLQLIKVSFSVGLAVTARD